MSNFSRDAEAPLSVDDCTNIHFFIRTILQEHEAHFRSNLRTN